LPLLGSPQQLGGQQPAMSGDDASHLIHQNWVGKAERANRRDDLLDLALGMGARVAPVWSQARKRLIDDDEGRRCVAG